MHRALAAACIFGLAGCAENFEAPEAAKALAADQGAQVIRQEVIVVSAALRRGSAFAELNAASCVLRRGNSEVQFSTPHKIAVPVAVGAQDPLTVKCTAEIGPRQIAAETRVAPIVGEAKAETTDKRYYPSAILVSFKS